MNNDGTLVIAPIRPFSEFDTFPTAYANEIKGGMHNVNSIAERNAIPEGRRVFGMMVSVPDIASPTVLKYYKLLSSPWAYDDTDWEELVAFVEPDEFFYTNTVPVPQTLGGVLEGTTFDGMSLKGLLDTMLYPQLQPRFSWARINGVSGFTNEVGYTFPADNYNFTWLTLNSGFVIPDSIKLYNHTTGALIATDLANDGAETIALGSITKITKFLQYWRLQGSNTSNVNFAAYMYQWWMWKRYVGSSANPVLTDVQIQALTTDSSLSRLVTGTYSFSVDPGYKYFAFPIDSGWVNPYNGYWYQKYAETFVDATTNMNVAMADSTDGYTDYTNGLYHKTISIINVYGHTQTYFVYRTKHILNGTVTVISK